MTQTAPKPEEEKKGIDINIWELMIDKSLDFVLIFVGLYAAIAVQKWQDAKKEREDYTRIVADFTAEVTSNRDQRGTIESQIGKTSDVADDKILGKLSGEFEKLATETAEADKLLGCLALAIEVSNLPAPTPPQQEKLAACAPVFAELEKEGEAAKPDEEFKPVTLTPFYRKVVFQQYLSKHVGTFADHVKNKELAVKLGELYENADRVEKLVDEIERKYNADFGARKGDADAIVQELEDSQIDAADIKADGPRIKAQLEKAAKDVRAVRIAATRNRGELTIKVKQLKELLERMDKTFGEVLTGLEGEGK